MQASERVAAHRCRLQRTPGHGPRAGGRALQPHVTLGVRLALRSGGILRALGEALVVGVFVDDVVAVVPGGLSERLGDGRAVPGAFDLEEPVGLVRDTQVVLLVVVDRSVVEGEGRELELLRLGAGKRSVGGEETGSIAAGSQVGQDLGAVAPDRAPRLVEHGHGENEIREKTVFARRRGSGHREGDFMAPQSILSRPVVASISPSYSWRELQPARGAGLSCAWFHPK